MAQLGKNGTAARKRTSIQKKRLKKAEEAKKAKGLPEDRPLCKRLRQNIGAENGVGTLPKRAT